jgi:hypothetical protein
MIHNHCLIIINHDSQPLAEHNTPWLTGGCESWWEMRSQCLWIMIWFDGLVVVNRGELCWASGCKSWCVMLSQWLWIMVYYAEPVVVNHGELWWASGVNYGVIWWGRVSIVMSYAEPVAVNHGVLCWASGCQSWCVMLSWRLWMIYNHWLSIAHHDSQPLTHQTISWFTNTGSSFLIMIHNRQLSITHHDWQPLAQHNTPWFTTTGSA